MKKSKKKAKVKNKENVSKIKHLETLLMLTLRCVDGRSQELDSLFTNQGKRIQTQINKLK